jgi:hypothetical protein
MVTDYLRDRRYSHATMHLCPCAPRLCAAPHVPPQQTAWSSARRPTPSPPSASPLTRRYPPSTATLDVPNGDPSPCHRAAPDDTHERFPRDPPGWPRAIIASLGKLGSIYAVEPNAPVRPELQDVAIGDEGVIPGIDRRRFLGGGR